MTRRRCCADVSVGAGLRGPACPKARFAPARPLRAATARPKQPIVPPSQSASSRPPKPAGGRNVSDCRAEVNSSGPSKHPVGMRSGGHPRVNRRRCGQQPRAPTLAEMEVMAHEFRAAAPGVSRPVRGPRHPRRRFRHRRGADEMGLRASSTCSACFRASACRSRATATAADAEHGLALPPADPRLLGRARRNHRPYRPPCADPRDRPPFRPSDDDMEGIEAQAG